MFKMFNVGFGESILLTNPDNNKCLLVDCGSESEDKNDIFDKISKKIIKYQYKSALLTHFHNDHINGFIQIIKTCPHLFDSIYIPNIFVSQLSLPNYNRFNLIDMEIIKHLLKMKKCDNGRLSILELLEALVKSSTKIKSAERGDRLYEIDSEFEILWPNPDYLIDEDIRSAIKKDIPISDDVWQTIYTLSDNISTIYFDLLKENTDYNTEKILENINDIQSRIYNIKDIDISEKTAIKWLDKIKKIENDTSIVMQSKFFGDPILLTGDIGSSIMEKVCENKYSPSTPIYSHYKVIKASHHGTDSNHFVKFDTYVKYDSIAISNGKTPVPNRGKISKKYNSKFSDYYIYCTNFSKDRCQYTSQFSDFCCNAYRCNLKDNERSDIKVLEG
ncbi:MAG: hypothetical protein Q4E21_02275 [Clostridia bacterium]|nr:hypothetical protein [Clostridia bacterium]